jgi:chemotaxis protein methyltransferase CheR
MKYNLSDNIMIRLSEFISVNLALNFPRERWDDLARNITSASKEFGYEKVEDFIQFIISAPLNREHIEILAANLTIGETYFWREPQTFEAFEQNILPELINRRKNGTKSLRIWSAGCSTGEEPYSIAIALHRTIPDIRDWNISILATDINDRSILKAIAGRYTQWSFRGTPGWLKENYFIKTPKNIFEIIPTIKSMVRYEYLNLAEDIYPSPINATNAMDIIYCRNVLMYFTQERFRKVVRNLYKSLAPEGFLIVSASELSMQNFPDFKAINFPGVVLYQKSTLKIKRHQPQPNIYEDQTPIPIEPYITVSIPWLKTESESSKINPSILSESPIVTLSRTKIEEAQLSYAAGNYSDVVDIMLEEAQSSEEYILLIKSFANLGNLDEAIRSCENALSAQKVDPRLHYLYATILQENNLLDESVAAFKNVIFLDHNFVLAYYSLGKIYTRLGKTKNAARCHETVVSILDKCKQDDILLESEGLTAGRFKEIISASVQESKKQ